MPRINTVLLIDDDDGSNFIHSFVIDESKQVSEIFQVQSAQEALDFLQARGHYRSLDKLPDPDLIFLDLNMPNHNGWDFLDLYQELPEKYRKDRTIIMLTSSIHRSDRAKAERHPLIDEFVVKPLTSELFIELLDRHFPVPKQRS